ncbi:hypothetical protein Tdes44962_MAKER02180 [Teratosphaeria destructans]|uniref:Regulator of volume decrease after cellular swelling-domain-containing protein n=1 Tax=Teratosphaeria destructans TaxID=418781 RepID=A0A9W7SUS8_9PEZI|nr:hypothetical protein Tdes44962_MAKER02180 [Teratosphaeria destructans]
MAYECISDSPKAQDFIPLSEHQEQTPGTFFGGKAVLHLQHSGSLKISTSELASHSDFSLGIQSGDEGYGEEEVTIDEVEIWVSSRHLTLYRSKSYAGIQIPYPTITIHAQQGNAVLLELSLSDADTADDDLDFLQVRLIPSPESGGTDEVKLLYDAISACQELNPDPDPDGDGEGNFDETAPGATGWITSENLADFMDENGNLRMPEGAPVIGGAEEEAETNGDGSLGEGAGRRRGADELVDGEVDGDAKWQRTG